MLLREAKEILKKNGYRLIEDTEDSEEHEVIKNITNTNPGVGHETWKQRYELDDIAKKRLSLKQKIKNAKDFNTDKSELLFKKLKSKTVQMNDVEDIMGAESKVKSTPLLDKIFDELDEYDYESRAKWSEAYEKEGIFVLVWLGQEAPLDYLKPLKQLKSIYKHCIVKTGDRDHDDEYTDVVF